MRGYPKFSFSISIALFKIYISRTMVNRGKNTFELVGTVLNMHHGSFNLPNFKLVFRMYNKLHVHPAILS